MESLLTLLCVLATLIMLVSSAVPDSTGQDSDVLHDSRAMSSENDDMNDEVSDKEERDQRLKISYA